MRGGNRGADRFDGGGGRSTLIRSAAGFLGELPEMWVVSLIVMSGPAVSGCSIARFLTLGGLDTSQLLKSDEGGFLFALEPPAFLCFASMNAAAAWTSPLHRTRVSSTTSCLGNGTVSRLITIAINVSVSTALFIAKMTVTT